MKIRWKYLNETEAYRERKKKITNKKKRNLLSIYITLHHYGYIILSNDGFNDSEMKVITFFNAKIYICRYFELKNFKLLFADRQIRKSAYGTKEGAGVILGFLLSSVIARK